MAKPARSDRTDPGHRSPDTPAPARRPQAQRPADAPRSVRKGSAKAHDPLDGLFDADAHGELDQDEAEALREAIEAIDTGDLDLEGLDAQQADAHAPGSAGSHRPSEPPPSQREDAPRDVVDRRLGLDRRTTQAGPPTGLERRRGRGRRLSDFHRAAEEGEMTQEQFMFLMAIDAFKKGNNVAFPAWSDVLEVIRLLGYRKVQPSAVDLGRAEDWTEPPEAPHNVRTDKQLQRHAAARAAFRSGRDGSGNRAA